MHRQQKTPQGGIREAGKTESEKNRNVPSVYHWKSTENCVAEDLFARFMTRDNFGRAYTQVVRNKGSAGIDKMTVKDVYGWFCENAAQFFESIEEGNYRPLPVKRVEIPKPDGGVRKLGVPTVLDRIVQQAVAQILVPIYETQFSEFSFGFRPSRKAQDAILKARQYYEQGYTWVVDLDLSKYFDTINHDLLMNILRRTIHDTRLLLLIKKFLKSGVMINGLISVTQEGAPQGGNLSPILSNIYLHEFDKELERRGHKFVRYADDVNIYVKSKRAAERVMASCVKFLEGKLKLKVNKEKSTVGRPTELKFLGFCLGLEKDKVVVRIHPKSKIRFENQIRKLTKRKQGRPPEFVFRKLREYVAGWLGYYGLARAERYIQDKAGWTRRRVRAYFWTIWKTFQARYTNLKRLGAREDTAYKWSYSSKGAWRIAGSQVLNTTLTNEALHKMGMLNFVECYHKTHARLNVTSH